MRETAVVILNWNGLAHLKSFLPLLVERTPRDNVSIVVADNNSDDGSVIWLKGSYPQIRVIELKENYGFAGGYNRAIGQIEATNIVLINSDIEVTDGWLEPLTTELRNNPETAATQPKILSYNNPGKFEHAGAAGGFLDRNGYPFCRGRILSHTETDTGQYNQSIEVSWTSGACMAIRREAFIKAGGFDDDFFAHMEEIDLCWRLKSMGYMLSFNPESTVYHVGGGTLPYNSPFKVYLNFRNSLFMLYKNLPKGYLYRKLISRMILDGGAALAFLAQGKPSLFAAVFKAHIHFWRQIKELKLKRVETIKLNTSKSAKMLISKSILFRYYFLGERTYNQIMR